jgi:hypothetical protein
VFPVRYGLDSYTLILFRRYSVFKGLMMFNLTKRTQEINYAGEISWHLMLKQAVCIVTTIRHTDLCPVRTIYLSGRILQVGTGKYR